MSAATTRPHDVLLVEDDIADAMLIQDALAERGTRNLTQSPTASRPWTTCATRTTSVPTSSCSTSTCRA